MNNNYLKQFCIAISNDRELSTTSFLNLYENSITHFTPYLKTEIQENILNIEVDKQSYYLNYVISQIEKTPFFNTPVDSFNAILLDYDDEISISDFPYFKNDLYEDLKSFINNNLFNEQKLTSIETLQYEAFSYAAMLEAKKMIEFVNEQKCHLNKVSNVNSKIKWKGKPSQLGFIIGMMADLEYIEPPRLKNNEINYTQFAKQIQSNFEIETTLGTLSKYLNVFSGKGQETKRKFEKEDFYIPNRKIVS